MILPMQPGSAFPSELPGGAASTRVDGVLLETGYRAADRLFFWLLLAHLPLIAVLAAAYGRWQSAILFGVPCIAVGMWASWQFRGTLVARLAVATSLLLLSALIIHQSGGMIEMHFHIFAALAFLLMYRDWRVPVWGAVVTALHHVTGNVAQTDGGLTVFHHGGGWGIVAIHAGWVVFEVAILVYMARQLAAETRQAEALLGLAERLGEGDLTARVERGAGAVGDAVEAINRGTAQIGGAIRAVRDQIVVVHEVATSFSGAADHVTRAATEVSSSLTQIASAAQEQAEGTQHMARALSGMTVALDAVATRASDVSSASEHAAQVAQSGAEVVSEAVGSLDRIREIVLESAREIGQLKEFSEQIGDINQMITGVASQTNLLALNAAIEAARAGEHGRGFAVVADEVRKLASQSGDSARHAADLIRSIQQVTGRVVMTMERGTAEVEASSQRAAHAGGVLREIVTVVQHSNRDIKAITRSAAEISRESRDALAEAGISTDGADGAQTLDDLVAASLRNAAAAEDAAAAVEEINASMQEMSASAEELASIAQELQSEVLSFRVEGEAPAALASTAPRWDRFSGVSNEMALR
ncbi:MAG TPA: methyl-accepting chemotaxis protein [Longimicrobium sp.]|nr:methyl-accepting chemotaxis protein [Longimicrobium sp.]